MIRHRFAHAVLAVLVLLSAPAQADEALEAGARTFIQDLAGRAVQSLTVPDISRAERVERFRSLFNEHFAVKGIGIWVLSRYWRQATPEQQEEYLHLFEDLIVASYVDRFAEYAGETLDVQKALTMDERHASVHTEIVRPTGGPPVNVDWRVGHTDGGFKIVDVVVEGTSMSTTMRSDFSSIIRQHGGEVAGLLEELRKKTKSLRADAT